MTNTADILTVIAGKTQVLLMTLLMALFSPSVPVNHDSVTVNNNRSLKPKQLHGIQSSLILLVTHVFPTVTCQNVFCEKAYLPFLHYLGPVEAID